MVRRVEIITPEMEALFGRYLNELSDPVPCAHEMACRGLRKYARFAEPILKHILAKTTDDTLKARIREIIRSKIPGY